MNHAQDDLLQRLEQATAMCATSDVPLDDETAELRQSWLYLTQLLSENDDSKDASELVQRVVLPTRENVWITVALRALAASLLVMVVTWMAVGDSQPNATQHAFPRPSPRSETVAGASDLDEEFAWSDQLDEQLDAVGQTLIAIQSDWRSNDSHFSLLQERLDRIEQEMQTGAL